MLQRTQLNVLYVRQGSAIGWLLNIAWGRWYVSRHPIIASVVFGSSRLPRPTSDYRIGRVLIVSAARFSLAIRTSSYDVDLWQYIR